MVVVHVNVRNIALIAREHSRFLFNWSLGTHIMGGSAIEVIAGPLEEVLLGEDVACLGVIDIKFGV